VKTPVKAPVAAPVKTPVAATPVKTPVAAPVKTPVAAPVGTTRSPTAMPTSSTVGAWVRVGFFSDSSCTSPKVDHGTFVAKAGGCTINSDSHQVYSCNPSTQTLTIKKYSTSDTTCKTMTGSQSIPSGCYDSGNGEYLGFGCTADPTPWLSGNINGLWSMKFPSQASCATGSMSGVIAGDEITVTQIDGFLGYKQKFNEMSQYTCANANTVTHTTYPSSSCTGTATVFNQPLGDCSQSQGPAGSSEVNYERMMCLQY